MPHAHRDMGDGMSNGDSPPSQFISHLTSYPVVHDSIETYKQNPLGQKSLDVAEAVYDRFGRPVLPYLRGPYSYVAPYVERADSMADEGLNKVDENFPVMKTDTDKITSSLVDLAFLPFRLVGETRDYLLNTYSDEYRKTGGHGIFTSVQALISTELRIAAEFLQTLQERVVPKAKEAKHKAQHSDFYQRIQNSDLYQSTSLRNSDLYNSLEDTAKSAKKSASQGMEGLRQNVEYASEQAQQKGGEWKERTKQTAEDFGERTKQTANEAGEKTRQTANDASERTKQTANDASEKGKQMGHDASEKTKQTANDASEKSKQMGHDASEKSKQTAGDAKEKSGMEGRVAR